MATTTRSFLRLGVALGLILLGADALHGGTPRLENYIRQPLAFEANRGQTDPRVKFLARGQGYGLFLTPAEAVLALGGEALRLRWEGARSAPRISGEKERPGRTNYLTGNDPARWRRGIPSFEKVRYQSLYPGIDLVFYGNPRQLEFDFVLAPGADPDAIRLAIQGQERMEIDGAGDLVLHLGAGEVRLKRPASYQEIGGVRRPVASGWRRTDDGRLGFAVGKHDPSRPLVIDPVLAYSTYLGGSGYDDAYSVAVDPAGNAYVTGSTLSSDFPAHDLGRPSRPATDTWVAKFDPAGRIVYTTYIGGPSAQISHAIAVDPQGNAYVAGETNFNGFPVVGGLGVPADPGSTDAFVLKLDPTGSSLVYSTRLGGNGQDTATAIAVDGAGHAYVTGYTEARNFPTVNALQGAPGAGFNAFVAKLAPSGSSLVYSTYLGGSQNDLAAGIAVDSAGRAIVAGGTESATDFPLAHAFQASGQSGFTVFITKLAPDGSSFVYSTYFGGNGTAYDVDADAAGNAYVTGVAFGDDRRGQGDGFVAQLSPMGIPVFSTYLGGSGLDQPNAIAVDAAGRVFVAGYTTSPDFPLRDPLRATCAPLLTPFDCASDAFVAALAPGGSGLLFSTYLGGSIPTNPGNEEARGIATDHRGGIYVAGRTNALDFPTVAAAQPTSHGAGDAFLSKIQLGQPPVCTAAFASPAALWPPNGKLVPISIRNVTDPEGDPVTMTITGVRQDEAPQGGPAAVGIGTPGVSLRADRDGKGDGRVYHITFEASDGNGGVCTGMATVCVPHDQGTGKTCGDGGALFNSNGGTR
ncbi:MAG: SBBP repeat-containing protein [Thermoanaerobaculia bacterium]